MWCDKQSNRALDDADCLVQAMAFGKRFYRGRNGECERECERECGNEK
jgi:hypothetical protein